MSEHGLTTENFLLTLPPALAADETMQALAEGLARVLAGRLEELGFSVLPSQTNFVFAKSGKISGGALDRGLKERGVLVRWWAGSGRIEDFVRITVGSMEQLKILVEQIAALLEKR